MSPFKFSSLFVALVAGVLLAGPRVGHTQASGGPPISGVTGICSSGGCVPSSPCVGGTLCEAFPEHPAYDPNVQFRKGAAAIQSGDYQEAKRLFEQALYLAPTNSAVLFALGVANVDLGDLTGAQEAFERALKWNPKHIDAARELAVTDLKLGATDKAELQLASLKKRASQCRDTCREADDLKTAIGAIETAQSRAAPTKPNL